MTKTFLDRSDQLFGREDDVCHLVSRASHPGVTAVVAGPLMGKTWTLTEVARRLTEGHYLVGYHESTAAESSHLLYAVSSLYAQWLADSTKLEQTKKLLEVYKKDFVPRLGQMIGSLCAQLNDSLLPPAVWAIVRKAFDSLASAHHNLQSHGLNIAPLPYDEALSLTQLVAKISKRHIVLILDAWEKSHSIDAESTILEHFLKHKEDWPHTHVFLAVRNPDRNPTQTQENASRRAGDLCTLSPAAKTHNLLPMDLTEVSERARMVGFVRDKVAAANHVNEQSLIEMIGGYPGVLNFWIDCTQRGEIKTQEDLSKEANNAHENQYPALDGLLSSLTGDKLVLAARLAFLHRLDKAIWETFGRLIMKNLVEDAFTDLIDTDVLQDDSVPTYGHDTRHAAARRWFFENRRPVVRRTAEEWITSVASRIRGTSEIDINDRLLMGALVVCSEEAEQVRVSPNVYCLIQAAQSIYGDVEGITQPSFDEEYPKALQANPLVAPLISIALLNRGVSKGHAGDNAGAIADYTAVIRLPGAAPEQVAMAHASRAISKMRLDKSAEAAADFTAVIELPGARPEQVAQAFFRRGAIKLWSGDIKEAIADFTDAINLPGATFETVQEAYNHRAAAKHKLGDIEGALADFCSTPWHRVEARSTEG